MRSGGRDPAYFAGFLWTEGWTTPFGLLELDRATGGLAKAREFTRASAGKDGPAESPLG